MVRSSPAATSRSTQNGHAPAQRGVVVLGMHRSGTSALTRVIDLLGVPVCQPGDHFDHVEWNSSGLWESRSLSDFDDRLMHRLGGTWWAPPTLPRGWARRRDLEGWRDEARHLFSVAHPAEQWLWKDPRACILLPFWQTVVGVAAAHVLLLRNPIEIGDSLLARHRLDRRLAFALWERHLREGLRNCAGRAVLVTTFDELLDDPATWCANAHAWLARQGLRLQTPIPLDAVSEFLDPGLRHHRRDDQLLDDSAITPEQQRLWQWALARRGGHQVFAVGGLPAESPSSEQVIDVARFRALLQLPPSPPTPATAPQARRVRQRRALTRVVVISHNEGEMLLRTIRAFERTLPERGEILVVDDCSTDGSAAAVEAEHPAVTVVRARTRLGISAARNLGARHGDRPDVVVWSDAHCEPEGDWLRPVLDALSDSRVGMVGPAIAQLGAANPVWGFGFVWRDPSMAMRWLPRRHAAAYPVPFLCGCLLAMRSEVLARTEGFDEGLVVWGMEDSELCLRLWLMGYECRVAPNSQVRHLFRPRFPYAHDLGWMYHNILRVGAVHFNDERTERMIRHYGAGGAHFSIGMARLLRSDHQQRRRHLDASRVRDDEWFFARFDTDVFPRQLIVTASGGQSAASAKDMPPTAGDLTGVPVAVAPAG